MILQILYYFTLITPLCSIQTGYAQASTWVHQHVQKARFRAGRGVDCGWVAHVHGCHFYLFVG
ncbi:ORF044 [Saltwater crocodilepox virus]|nr:ORF044 [Saltwater crocodilepox virus]QGT48839.1 ORF044 [Saltwater crocodilepox virus]QGT49052.1 ORF044 [Saltwater crocodilepox virus]